MYCRKCGNQMDDTAMACPKCGAPTRNSAAPKEDTHKRAWPIVFGVLSIVASVAITFQSCAVGLAEALGSDSTDSGAGLLVAILTLAGGIVLLPTRNKPTKWASTIIFALAAVIALCMTDGFYEDLIFWGIFALVQAIICLVSSIRGKRSTAAKREGT